MCIYISYGFSDKICITTKILCCPLCIAIFRYHRSYTSNLTSWDICWLILSQCIVDSGVIWMFDVCPLKRNSTFLYLIFVKSELTPTNILITYIECSTHFNAFKARVPLLIKAVVNLRSQAAGGLDNDPSANLSSLQM